MLPVLILCPSQLEIKITAVDPQHTPAGARFTGENGEDEMMRCLERNEAKGVVYHYEGELIGGYDRFETDEEIIGFLRNGPGV